MNIVEPIKETDLLYVKYETRSSHNSVHCRNTAVCMTRKSHSSETILGVPQLLLRFLILSVTREFILEKSLIDAKNEENLLRRDLILSSTKIRITLSGEGKYTSVNSEEMMSPKTIFTSLLYGSTCR